MATATALRDLLLATERARTPLDAALRRFVEAATDDPRLLSALLDVGPQAEPLVANWPDDGVAKGARWEDRESIAVFLELTRKLLHTQAHERQKTDAAEALALKIVREKSASLEKMLSWSDKPLVEFRVLELLTTVVGVSANCAREFVRIFNFQSPAFTKLATRRMKKAAPTAGGDDDASPEQDGLALSTTTTSAASKPNKAAAACVPTFQIRAAYVRLVAALAACPDRSVHRFALKDGGIMASLFKSVDGDDAAMLAIVIDHFETLVLRNENVDSRGRMAILNNAAVQQLVTVAKYDDEDVATLASAMLLKLLFGEGALYQLPAKQSLRLFLLKSSLNATHSLDTVDASSSDNTQDASNAAAKVIRGVIGSISLNDYVRSGQVRRLTSKILLEYPGLAHEFIGALGPQLEPKPGYRWFCIASMAQNVLSASLDAVLPDIQSSSSHSINGTQDYSAEVLASRLIMPLSCRKELSRGLQHTNNLVIYSSLGLIESALRRFQFVKKVLPAGAQQPDLENELRFLLPSPETLVSLLMKLCAGVENAALVYLRALTVFRLYLECLPLAMSESKADFTKLLAWQYLDGVDGNTSRAIRGVIVGELLRVLMVVDEARLRYVVTSGSGGNVEASKLSQLLRMYSYQSGRFGEANHSLVRAVLNRVFVALKVFGSTTEFSCPIDEIRVWLDNMATGGDAITIFVETMIQDLVSDPFLFLTSSAEGSISPSPTTLALIAAMRNTWPLARSASKLSGLLENPSVPAFASRVLLSLMCRNTEPATVAHLLCADGASIMKDHGQSESPSIKKRRRSSSIDLTSIGGFQCVTAIAQAVLKPASVRTVTSSSTTLHDWKASKGEKVFADCLFALQASTFVDQFPNIVRDLVRLQLPARWIHHFIGARPDVDLLKLAEVVDATSKKDKHIAAVMRDLVETLPLELVSQHLLFSLSVYSRGDRPTLTISKLINQVRSKTEPFRLVGFPSHMVALVAEQLLICIEIARHAEMPTIEDELYRVLLRLQVHLVSTRNGDVSDIESRRLQLKLKASSSLLSTTTSKLRTVGLIGLAHIGSDSTFAETELHRLRHAGSSVLASIVARSLPTALRLHLLRRLLTRPSIMNPLVFHTINTLDQMSSATHFKPRVRLAQRLWHSLIALQGVEKRSRQFEVLSTGLHVVTCLGGISESSYRESLSAWAQFLTAMIDQNVKRFDELVLFVRRLRAAVRRRESVAGSPPAFDEFADCVINASYSQYHNQIIAAAVVLVSTYGNAYANGNLRRAGELNIGKQLFEVAAQHSLRSPEQSPVGLIVLRQLVVGNEQPSFQFQSVESVIASFEKGICPSKSQLLAVLLTLRNSHEGMWSPVIAVFLVRSAITYALDSDADKESSRLHLHALYLMLRDLIECAPSEKEVHDVVSKVSSDLKRFIAADWLLDESSYFRYVRASRVVNLLFANQYQPLMMAANSYTVHAHLDKLCSHELFSSSLKDTGIRVELLRVVGSLLDLAGANSYTRTLFQNLLAAYNASLSLPDRLIRVLLDQFESNVGILASQYGYRFGSSSVAVQSQKQDGSARSDLIEDSTWLFSGGLEPTRMRATIEWFPLNRSISVKSDTHLLRTDDLVDELDDDCHEIEESSRAIVYDPSYLLPMLSPYVASSAIPETAMIQQGVIGVAVRSISSNADDVREYAYAILGHVYESLSADAATDFKPGRQIHLMLDTLRNALQEPLEGVSSVITVFMNDAISILCRPGHTMYPHVNHFLLARPAFDLSDVPMFYSLFNSHSPQTYKQERSWLLHSLRRGVREDADVSLLIRRHVPSILMSFFGSDLADEHTQLLVTNILSAMLKTEAGAQYLLTKCAFLEWLTGRFNEVSTAATPFAILLALCTLLEESLKATVWGDIDGSQRQALGSAAVNCYESLVIAVHDRRAVTVSITKTQLTRIALLVLQQASTACSLSAFKSVFSVDFVEASSDTTIECVSEFLSERLLIHHEFQKTRFVEWSELFARVACIIARELRVVVCCRNLNSHEEASIDREILATKSLCRLRDLLAEVPSLKLLVLNNLSDDITTTSLLL